MKEQELIRTILHHEAQGLEYAVLTVGRAIPPKGNQCALMPGIVGRVLGVGPKASGKWRVVVMVEVARIRRWMEKRGVAIQEVSHD